MQIREHQGGPAILFRHRGSDLRLDAYLDAYGGQLTPAPRLGLVRQLAEALRYAHNTRLAAERVRQRVVDLAETSGPRFVLLVHEAGLLAQYWEAGGRELLVALQRSARRPADTPHGLWLLLPMKDPRATPTLDGR
ncbi:hypothetical protein ABZZ79_29815 [Streptomyces sp. NPDC006458]|uniref:hypothetical protein n=1 Tax=Streptomyces sp. NPDC006458 TaxID=3154302 RepID=UPI0033BAE0CB